MSQNGLARIFGPPNTADSQLLDFATESLLHQCVHAPTRFRVNQVPSLLDLIFVKFPNLTSPSTIQPLLGKSDHALLQWTYTSAVPQPPPSLVRLTQPVLMYSPSHPVPSNVTGSFLRNVPSTIYGYPSEIKSPFLHRRQPRRYNPKTLPK